MSMWSGSSTGFHYDDTEVQGVYRHLVDPLQVMAESKNTTWDYISRNPEYKVWSSLIKQSGFDKILSDPQRASTVFVVSDRSLYNVPGHVLSKLDAASAADLISFMIAKELFTTTDFKQTPGLMYITTFNPRENLLINSMTANIRVGKRPLSMSSMPSINADSRIIPERSDVLMGNGIVHEILYPVVPERR